MLKQILSAFSGYLRSTVDHAHAMSFDSRSVASQHQQVQARVINILGLSLKNCYDDQTTKIPIHPAKYDAQTSSHKNYSAIDSSPMIFITSAPLEVANLTST